MPSKSKQQNKSLDELLEDSKTKKEALKKIIKKINTNTKSK
ncbi:hypothetical protein [Winogradskyella pulchriflava]|uniref:Uncharacterized protein n=1 Tax=Winogradskyella pulchriflava TaxID=1110688 RepID=A0ABV6Q6B1_9FLAO